MEFLYSTEFRAKGSLDTKILEELKAARNTFYEGASNKMDYTTSTGRKFILIRKGQEILVKEE